MCGVVQFRPWAPFLVHQAHEKTFATLSPIEQFRLNQFHFYPEHPETTPHIHSSVMLISPALVDRFKAIAPELERLFQSLGPANCTLLPNADA